MLHLLRGSLLKALLPHILLLIVAVLLFSPFFLRGEVFLAADVLHKFDPWKSNSGNGFQPRNWGIADPILSYYPGLYSEALKSGSIPLWNPHVFLGTPAHMSIGMGQPGRYSPLKLLLHWLLPTMTALNAYLFIHVLLMGCFMHMYLSRINSTSFGSIFGALIYMLNGYAMVWLEFESWVATASMLPLLLLMLEGFTGANRVRYSFLAAFSLGLLILAGNAQLTLYAGILMISYFGLLIVLRGGGPKNAAPMFGCLGIAILGGAAIGSIELLPFLELAAESFRQHFTSDLDMLFERTAHVPWRYFITVLYPFFFGSPLHDFFLLPTAVGSFYMNYNEVCLYMGTTSAVVFAAATVLPKNARARFHFLTVLLVSVMVAGTTLYWPIYALVPGMDRINPTRLIFLYSFSFPAFCGLGVDMIRHVRPHRRPVILTATAIMGIAVILLALLGGSEWFSRWVNHEAMTMDTKHATDLLKDLMSFRDISSPVIAVPLALASASLLLVMAIIFFPNRSAADIACVLLLLLTVLDLLSFAKTYNTTSPPETVYEQTPALHFIDRHPRPFRVLMISDDFFSSTMHANTLAALGIDEIGGYSSLYPHRTNFLLSYMRFGKDFFSGDSFNLDISFDELPPLSFLQILNVRFLVASPHTQLHHPAYREVYRNDLAIFENTEVLPRAFIVHRCVLKKDMRGALTYMGSPDFDADGEVVLEEQPDESFLRHVRESERPSVVTKLQYGTDRVEISAELPANGWLVLADTFYPGWRARVDGIGVPVLPADFALRAVPLEAGSHQVVFTYEPVSIRWGMLLSIIGFTTAVAGLLGSLLKKRKTASCQP